MKAVAAGILLFSLASVLIKSVTCKETLKLYFSEIPASKGSHGSKNYSKGRRQLSNSSASTRKGPHLSNTSSV